MNGVPERLLLVPMNVQAMVIGASPGTDWVDLKPDFRGVYFNQVLGQQLENEPCTTKGPGLNAEAGVHLHWALPAGLTHGVAGESGQPAFPLIPNRWLIVRLWDAPEQKNDVRLQHRAWIVESDVISGNDEGTIWPNLRAQRLDPAREQDYAVRLGTRFELERWAGESSAPAIEVTAAGYGDPSFAAYYPACRDMLGFHDRDLSAVENASLIYFVGGWYSQPDKDPLHRALTEKSFACLDDFLAEAKWIYPGYTEAAASVQKVRAAEESLADAREMSQRISAARPDAKEVQAELAQRCAQLEEERRNRAADATALEQNVPAGIVCHGIVSGIRWRSDRTLYESGIARGKPFQLALGNTFVEALAALFHTRLEPRAVRLLEAFQYDLLSELEKPGGEEALEQRLHERGYRSLSRGTRWEVIEDTASALEASSGERAPPVPGDVRVLLENVNIRQRAIDRLRRQRDSQKSELYAAWYRAVLTPGAAPVAREIADHQDSIKRLEDELAALQDDQERRPSGTQWGALQAGVERFLPGYRLHAVDELRFWRPNDPVVLLAGRPFQQASRQGEDEPHRPDGRLPCRLNGQEFTGITLSIPSAKVPDVEFGPEDLDRWCDPLPQALASRFPATVHASLRSLLHETLLITLDEHRAHDICAAAYDRNEPGLAAAHPQEVDRLALDLLQWLRECLDEASGPVRAPEDAEHGTSAPFRLGGVCPSPLAIHIWQKNPWLPLFMQWQVSWRASYPETQRALEGWTLNDTGTRFSGGATVQSEPELYSGTSLLTRGAVQHLAERMRQYNLSHDDPKLKEVQTAMRAMSVASQTLGGFTENLLMRKGRLELRPLEPSPQGRGPQPSPIREWVEDTEWLAPLSDVGFFPLRAGELSVEKLWVIDAFGQLLQLEEQDFGRLKAPLVHERLSGSGGAIRLEPRLAQPARLAIDWLPANRWSTDEERAALRDDEGVDPVCGWILPNLLDRGLTIYDARGHALGALQAVQRKSWDRGAGARREEIESFHWVDMPGSSGFFYGKPPQSISDPLGDDANPHLRAYVRALLALTGESGAAFGQLLDRMEEALASEGGADRSRTPGLALLMGRPLALLRATLRLEVDGALALAQGDVQIDLKARSGGIEKLEFPVRLGERRFWNGAWLGEDGVVGFFVNRDYAHFYPAYGLRGRDDGYSTYNYVPYISIDRPLEVTLLMDPARGVCVTSGILPRIIFHLPYGDIAEMLENKEMIFFTGPVVSTATQIRMPEPSDLYGQWSWTHHPAVEVWREEAITDTRKEEGRFFDDTLRIAEGWLKLVTAPVAIRMFGVQGEEPVAKERKAAASGGEAVPVRFEVPAGGQIVLTWAAIGADEVELQEGATALFRSQRHPLPVQCRVQLEHSTSFTLIASGRAKDGTRARETRTIEVSIAAGTT
jgi:hypothetical protein